MAVVKNRFIEGLFLRGALREEQWFRSGSEAWTVRQRMTSCMVFGWIHIRNLIYPVVTLISLCYAGGAMVYVYQREFKRSNDITRATLAATKLHARYNVYALRIFAVAMLIIAWTPIL